MELPARLRVLLEAGRSGTLETLLHEAARRHAEGTGASGRAQPEELPLGLPPRGRPALSDLDVDELAVELFRQPLGPRAVVNVHVPMASALGLDDSPARVDGGAHVPAWLARMLVPDAALRRVAVSAQTGVPLYVDRDVVTSHRRPPDAPPDPPPGPGRHRPPDPPGPAPVPPPSRSSEQQIHDEQVQLELQENERRLASARACQHALLSMVEPFVLPDTTEPRYTPSSWLRGLVESRDQRCTGPGCRRAARHCDLDHEWEFSEGGPTSEPNLGAKSRRCHLARHNGWTAVRDPRTSVITWTSPDGSVYVRLPAWVPHRSHEPVVRIGLNVTELPAAASDYSEDRPLWHPPAITAPQPAPPPPPPPPREGHDWSEDPPLL
jgi:hypothetical protein